MKLLIILKLKILVRLVQFDSKDISEEIKLKIIEDASYVEAKQSNIEHDIICLEFFILKVKKLLLNN